MAFIGLVYRSCDTDSQRQLIAFCHYLPTVWRQYAMASLRSTMLCFLTSWHMRSLPKLGNLTLSRATGYVDRCLRCCYTQMRPTLLPNPRLYERKV